MTTLLSSYALPLLVVVAIGFVVGFWIVRRSKAPPPPAAQRPHAERRQGEGRGLASEDAAAVADVAGQFLGLNVHVELPGASGPADNLQTLKGVGPRLAAKLNENGIIRFDQLAALTPEQVWTLDQNLDQFKGRIERDRLVEQAAYLARGDKSGFEAKFGNLGES